MDTHLAFAHRLADVADEVTMARFGRPDLVVEAKADQTPVTEADRRAEEAIRAEVRASGRPEQVFGEEMGEGDGGSEDGGSEDPGAGSSAGTGSGPGRRWIVDPIDGTTSFMRGIPVWATLLALEVDGVVEVGLASAPALGTRWWATRGGGAFVNGAPCRVSGVSRVEDALVSTTSQRRMPDGWRTIVARAWANRGFGDFWHHCLVAQGSVDVATDGGDYMRVWDYSAPQLIVEEAGGRCTTIDGRPPRDRASFISSNALLHEEVVALLAPPP